MGTTLTVRINRSTHAVLRALAEETDESMTDVLDQAIEAYRKQRFLLASMQILPRCVAIKMMDGRACRTGRVGRGSFRRY